MTARANKGAHRAALEGYPVLRGRVISEHETARDARIFASLKREEEGLNVDVGRSGNRQFPFAVVVMRPSRL